MESVVFLCLSGKIKPVLLRKGDWKMSRQCNIPNSIVWYIIGRLKTGKHKELTDAVEVAIIDLTRQFNRFQETRHGRSLPEQGHPWPTSANNARYILLTTQ
ncbi:hypothetical protein TNCV_2540061 [Trichonephila clavipes]|nr:hypothetical protein TNCV_2540061 [Trichonephila clavipes]